MKNKVTQLFLLLALAIGMAGFAEAQSSTPERMNVPFDFVAGEKSFKAGEYLVNFNVTSRNIIFIRSTDGKDSAILLGTLNETGKYTTGNKFVFERQEDKYVLTQINIGQARVEIKTSKNRVEFAGNPKSGDVL